MIRRNISVILKHVDQWVVIPLPLADIRWESSRRMRRIPSSYIFHRIPVSARFASNADVSIKGRRKNRFPTRFKLAQAFLQAELRLPRLAAHVIHRTHLMRHRLGIWRPNLRFNNYRLYRLIYINEKTTFYLIKNKCL